MGRQQKFITYCGSKDYVSQCRSTAVSRFNEDLPPIYTILRTSTGVVIDALIPAELFDVLAGFSSLSNESGI
jgi:hypothetical protein